MLLCAALPVLVADAESLSSELLYQRVLPQTVMVEGSRIDGGSRVQGSGCIVLDGAHVLITAHQAEGVTDHKARTSNGVTAALRLVAVDGQSDLALLSADLPLGPPVELGDSLALREGDRLYSVGAPKELDFSLVPGTVSSTRRTYRERPVIQAVLEAAAGSSGAPVFNAEGKLIGLISGELEEIRFTIIQPIEQARDLLAGVGKKRFDEESIPESQPLTSLPEATAPERGAIDAYNKGVAAKHPEDKVRHFARAVKLLPGFFEAWFNLARAEALQGNAGIARAAYERALTLRPDSVAVARNLGALYLQANEAARAFELLEEALALTPENPSLHNDAGVALRALGKEREAYARFLEAVALEPGHPAALFNAARAAEAMGERDDAVRWLKDYLDRYPEGMDAGLARQRLAALEAGH